MREAILENLSATAIAGKISFAKVFKCICLCIYFAIRRPLCPASQPTCENNKSFLAIFQCEAQEQKGFHTLDCGVGTLVNLMSL